MSDLVDIKNQYLSNLIKMCDFKITVPLTERTKNIHTNSLIYVEPITEMNLLEPIYANITRYQGTRWIPFRLGYWYVESVDINFSSGKQEMTIGLKPLPTVYNGQSLKTEHKKINTTPANTTTQTVSVDDQLTPPEWLSNTDKEWCRSTVKKAIGTHKLDNKLTVAKEIFKLFTNTIDYDYYPNLRHTTPKGNRKHAWSVANLNCADGANILYCLMKTAGINCRIKHVPNHYIVKLNIDNNVYWVDNHRRRGKGVFNDVWKGMTGNNEGNITNGEYING